MKSDVIAMFEHKNKTHKGVAFSALALLIVVIIILSALAAPLFAIAGFANPVMVGSAATGSSKKTATKTEDFSTCTGNDDESYVRDGEDESIFVEDGEYAEFDELTPSPVIEVELYVMINGVDDTFLIEFTDSTDSNNYVEVSIFADADNRIVVTVKDHTASGSESDDAVLQNVDIIDTWQMVHITISNTPKSTDGTKTMITVEIASQSTVEDYELQSYEVSTEIKARMFDTTRFSAPENGDQAWIDNVEVVVVVAQLGGFNIFIVIILIIIVVAGVVEWRYKTISVSARKVKSKIK